MFSVTPIMEDNTRSSLSSLWSSSPTSSTSSNAPGLRDLCGSNSVIQFHEKQFYKTDRYRQSIPMRATLSFLSDST